MNIIGWFQSSFKSTFRSSSSSTQDIERPPPRLVVPIVDTTPEWQKQANAAAEWKKRFEETNREKEQNDQQKQLTTERKKRSRWE
jgi:hypothetical protein